MDDDSRIAEHHAAEVAGFFKEHSAWLFGHAMVLTRGDRARAEDLVQDTFEAAARAWPLRGRTPGQQRVWLYTTLRNKEISDFRRRAARRRKLRLLSPLHQPGADVADGELAATAEQAAEVIRNLPGQQYRIARMRWEDGMKIREIADELGIAEGTVNSALDAVRKKLAAHLGPRYKPGKAGKEEAS